MISIRSYLAPVFALALIAAACGTSEFESATTPVPSPTPTPTPVPLDPLEILERSGQAMQTLRTFNFRLYHDHGSLELIPGLHVNKASGKVVNPDKLSVEFSGSFGEGFAIRSQVITVGSQTYMTNPLTGTWEASDASVSLLGFFSPTRGISEMMAQIEDASLVDTERSDKEYRLSGSLPTTALAPLVGSTLTNKTVRVELTIEAGSDQLLEARFKGTVTPTDVEDAERVIVLSFFNEDISIEAPSNSS